MLQQLNSIEPRKTLPALGAETLKSPVSDDRAVDVNSTWLEPLAALDEPIVLGVAFPFANLAIGLILADAVALLYLA